MCRGRHAEQRTEGRSSARRLSKAARTGRCHREWPRAAAKVRPWSRRRPANPRALRRQGPPGEHHQAGGGDVGGPGGIDPRHGRRRPGSPCSSMPGARLPGPSYETVFPPSSPRRSPTSTVHSPSNSGSVGGPSSRRIPAAPGDGPSISGALATVGGWTAGESAEIFHLVEVIVTSVGGGLFFLVLSFYTHACLCV
jgi:hypothetical protein